jgi:flagellar hook-basal body complex protein FliE
MIKRIDSFFPGSSPVFPSTPNQKPGGSSFTDTLKDMIQDVNNLQIEAKEVNEAFIRGDLEDLHQVTIAQEKARIALELLLEVRNKLLEGYQEIMRMQI